MLQLCPLSCPSLFPCRTSSRFYLNLIFMLSLFFSCCCLLAMIELLAISTCMGYSRSRKVLVISVTTTKLMIFLTCLCLRSAYLSLTKLCSLLMHLVPTFLSGSPTGLVVLFGYILDNFLGHL